jgi:hypothetical protein
MGVSVAQRLETIGLPNFVRVNWGNPCFKKRYIDRFMNQRAMANVLCARAVKEGRLVLPEMYRKDLLDQAARIPYHFNEKGKYVIMAKEKMREEGIPSPDLWDTVCQLFLESAQYTPSEAVYGINAGDRKDIARERALEELGNL